MTAAWWDGETEPRAPLGPPPVLPSSVPSSRVPSSPVPTTRVPDRGPTRAERRDRAAEMTRVLGAALAAQCVALAAAADDPAPEGWWFT